MKRFFYLIVLWSIPFVVNAEAQCYPNPDFSGTALSHCPSGDCTGAAPYKFVGENWSLRLDQVSGECLNSAHNGYWGDPDTYQAATIDANLSFDNPQVLTVTSAVDGTNFLIKSGGTAGTSWATETMDTNTHAAWAITSNGRVKIAFSTDDAVFTMDDGTQSVGPVFWMKEKDVDGNDTSNYEHLPTVYSVLVTNIADCNGTICNSTPSASEMDLTAGTPIPFSKLKGSATSSATSVSSETIDAKFVGWDGSPANLVSTTESAGFSSNLGDILVMDALGDSGVAANEFIVYQTKALQPDGSTVDYQRTYVQDNNVFVFVEATPTSGALNAQPGTYTASIKMTVVSVN